MAHTLKWTLVSINCVAKCGLLFRGGEMVREMAGGCLGMVPMTTGSVNNGQWSVTQASSFRTTASPDSASNRLRLGWVEVDLGG
jgi:hypothetical protein